MVRIIAHQISVLSQLFWCVMITFMDAKRAAYLILLLLWTTHTDEDSYENIIVLELKACFRD